MDSIQTIKITNSNILSHKIKLLQSFTYNVDFNRASREIGLLEETIKLVQKEKSVMYLLVKDNQYLGVISLSASSINDIPSSQIDYLFVDYNVRKEVFKELNNNRVSRYLILLAIQICENIRKNIGLKYLALYPDGLSKTLISHYKNELGFKQLNKEWLFVKLN
jgi:hypothetical protein